MAHLQIRQQRVVRLTEIALNDKNYHKYMQGRYILTEIEKRIKSAESARHQLILKTRP